MNNNTLEFFVKMKDLMSGGLASLARNARNSFAQIQAGINQTSASNNRLAESFGNVERRARSSASGIGNLTRQLTAYIGIGAALAFGGNTVKSAMDFGATKQTFGVLTGSEEKGNQLAGGLNKLQQDTILGPEVFKNAQTMMGFGIGAEKVIPTLKMLGDVSMGDAEKLNSLTLAFSQVSAGGKLTGQDLLQFINAGFNPLNEISKTTGKSMSVLKDEMSKGAISSQMVANAFETATGKGGLYNNMLLKLAETPYGKLQQLMGQFEALKVKIGEALMPLAEFLMKIAGFLIDHVELVVAVGTAWGVYAVATGGAAVAQGILNAIMAINPIILVISLIAGLVVWIYTLTKKYDGWGKSLMALWEVIKAFGNMASIPFKIFGETAWYYVQLLHLKILDFAQSVIGTFANVGTAIQMAMSGDFSGAKNALTATVETGASKQIKDLQDGHAKNQQQYAAEYAQNVKAMQDNAAKIGLTKKGGSLTAAGVATAGKTGSGASGSIGGEKKDSTASGITGSGPRVININGVTMKVSEQMHVTTGNVQDFMSQLEPAMQRMFMRILNSGANLQ